MGLLEELKHALGLDDEEVPPPSEGRDVIHLQQPPASFGPSPLRHLSPEEDRAAAEVQRNPDAPLMGPRPTLDPRRWLSPGDAPELQKAQLEADETDDPRNGVMVPPPPEKYKAVYVDQQNQLAPARDLDSARILAEASQTLRGRQGVAKGAGRFLKPASEAARAVSEPPGKAPPDTGKADLLAAIDKVAKPPEEAAEMPAPAQGEHPDPNPGPPPPTPPPESGGPLGSLTKMMMGAGADPRTERLRAALEKAAEMKRLAGHQRGMGIGADLVMGTHVHGDQGKDLEGRADDEVRNAMLPTEFEQKNARFDTEQQRAAQDMRLRESSEGRAQKGELRAEAGETRAGAEESRKGEAFKTQQGYTDPKSQTSANARASIEALYPAAWKKIPEAQRNNFSAKDVERIFGEIKPQDFAPKGAGGGVNDRMAVRLAAGAKLPNAGKILDLNDVLATIEAGKAPGTGYMMNKDGWQNFLRTPQGAAFKQKTQAIINKHIKDTTGLVVRESEEGRIMGELGYGSWDDANALDSGLHKMAEESQADLDQTLNKLPPAAKKLLIEQGAVPKIGGKYGKIIKGSERNFGTDDTFNPRELLRRVLGRGDRDRTLGSQPMSAEEQAAERERENGGDDEESRRRGFRF
jgi:hypothetical protein